MSPYFVVHKVHTPFNNELPLPSAGLNRGLSFNQPHGGWKNPIVKTNCILYNDRAYVATRIATQQEK